MKSYLLDTNALLRYLLGDVPNQTSTVRTYFAQAKDRTITITIPLLVFAEAFFALTTLYHLQPKDVCEKLKQMAKISYLDIGKRDILIKACSAYTSRSVGFIDLLLLFEAKATNKELLTFDKKLRSVSLSL